MSVYVNTRNHPLNPRLARMGFTTFLKMLLVDNFVHADCHSGTRSGPVEACRE